MRNEYIKANEIAANKEEGAKVVADLKKARELVASYNYPNSEDMAEVKRLEAERNELQDRQMDLKDFGRVA